MPKPPEQSPALGGARGNRNQGTNWGTLRLFVEAVKPAVDPQLARFHSAMAAFFRQLREELHR